jgi:hypothetical protein
MASGFSAEIFSELSEFKRTMPKGFLPAEPGPMGDVRGEI